MMNRKELQRGYRTFVVAICLASACEGNGTRPALLNRASEAPIGQIELLVTDPDGEPVEAARIKAGFYNPRDSDPKWHETTTDEHGRCVVTGRTQREIHYRVSKDNFYKTKGTYSCPHAARNEEPRIKNGYWQPRKPTVSVELRPIRNPIPMYVKEFSGFIPEQDEPCGYDLLKGDWVEPYGKGESADLLISGEGEYQDVAHRWSKAVFTFPRKHDGFLSFTTPADKYGNQSEYIIPYYQAPNSEYESEHVYFMKSWGDIRQNLSRRDNLHFIVRVRTKVNQDGDVIEALYGKIYGDMAGGVEWGGPRIAVGFTYYLNPTGTRNLEYDPPKNLFLRKPDGTYIPPYDDFARENGYIRGRP